MPVAEHHDGFQMYASDLSTWNAAERGPRRDVLGELHEAAGRHHLRFCASNHRADHWWFFGHAREFDSDIRESLTTTDPAAPAGSDLPQDDLYWPSTAPEPNEFDIDSTPAPIRAFLEDWLRRNAEIVDRFHPALLYFDWWVQHRAFRPYLKLIAAYYYNRMAARGERAAICYKYDALAWGAGIADVERGGFPEPTPFAWQTDTAIARNSWCYTDTLDYKPLGELIVTLVDTVAKNGTLLLNAGPRADGSFAARDTAMLTAIGDWLAANGDGIYGSRPWRVAAEGPTRAAGGMFADQGTTAYTAADWRFTARDGALYAYNLSPDGERELTARTFAAFDGEHRPDFNAPIARVEQLGAGDVPFTRDERGLRITPDYAAAARLRRRRDPRRRPPAHRLPPHAELTEPHPPTEKNEEGDHQ